MAKEKETEKVVDALQEAWEKFLVVAEEQRKRDGTHHIFLEQKERGEFDKIPQSFIDSLSQGTQIRVAPK